VISISLDDEKEMWLYMDTAEIEKIEKDKSVGYPFRSFNISMKGLKEFVGHLNTPVHVLRKDMKTIEEIHVDEFAWTGECVAIMFYNYVVCLDVPSFLGIKTWWNEKDKICVCHYALLEGFSEPVYWEDKESHYNYKASEIGSDFGRDQNWGCINCKPIDWFGWTDAIDEKEILIYENGQLVTPLKKTGCYMCANDMKIHMENAKKLAIENFDNKIHYYMGLIAKVKGELKIHEDHKVYLEKKRDDMWLLSPVTIWEKYPEFRK
jgi:hypothetical protein